MTAVTVGLVVVFVLLALAGLATELGASHLRADPLCRRHRDTWLSRRLHDRRRGVPCWVCIQERREDAEARRFFDAVAGRTPRAPRPFLPQATQKTAGQDGNGPIGPDPWHGLP